jgi:hypothetical protein
MRIAGVKTGHKDRGEIIELPHPQKLEEALKMEVAKLSEKNEEFKGHLTWARNVKTAEFSFTSKGALLKDKWQNNVYSATGTVEINIRRLSPDRLLNPKTKEFSIKFEDALDNWGMPDLKVTSLVLE